MENFIFSNPTTIDFGKEREKEIGRYIVKYNFKKVLLVYGSSRIKKDGLFDSTVKALREQNIEFVELGGVVSNPLISKVREGIEVARKNNVDAILSVGGGSCLDSSKAIAAGVKYKGDVWDLFIGKGSIDSALPLFDILTLAATGSEMNAGAVVTNEETKQKFAIHSPHLFPKVSIMNPVLMQTVTKDYLVYSASDIIAHCVEGYFTGAVQPSFQCRLIESIIKTVMETTEILIENPLDYNARAEFAWAATRALNGLTYAGTAGYSYPNHMIEHSLSALYNIPHGGGLSIVMPAWMKWYKTKNEKQFERFAREIFGKKTADEAINSLETWFNKVEAPTRLSQFKISESDFSKIHENVSEHAQAFGMSSVYTSDVLEKILKTAF